MNVGLIAHDNKKKLMQNFCIAYRGILSRHDLFATGTTGRLIHRSTAGAALVLSACTSFLNFESKEEGIVRIGHSSSSASVTVA